MIINWRYAIKTQFPIIERKGVHEVEHWARNAQLRNYLFMRGQKQLCVASPVLHFVDTSAFYIYTTINIHD